MRAQLVEIPGLTLHDQGVEQCGIVTFTIDGVDEYELAARLRTEGINISVSTIDFARYDFEARGLEAVARASVHYYNTEEELARFVGALARRAPLAGAATPAVGDDDDGRGDRGHAHHDERTVIAAAAASPPLR